MLLFQASKPATYLAVFTASAFAGPRDRKRRQKSGIPGTKIVEASHLAYKTEKRRKVLLFMGLSHQLKRASAQKFQISDAKKASEEAFLTTAGSVAPERVARLTQQGQHALWQLVGLGHHGSAGLLQNLRAAQIGGFRSEVSIHDAALGSGQIFAVHTQVGHH